MKAMVSDGLPRCSNIPPHRNEVNVILKIVKHCAIQRSSVQMRCQQDESGNCLTQNQYANGDYTSCIKLKIRKVFAMVNLRFM